MFLEIGEIDESKLEKGFLKQYIEFKKDNNDSILLFQIGDFYETFFKDAKVFSEVTGVTLGSRNVKNFGEVIQAGIPVHTVNLYIKKLLSENLKVCICSQVGKEDNEIKRVITRKYTQGTILENEFLDCYENNYILSIFADKDYIKIAYADVSSGQFYKTCGNIEEIIFEIDKISPNEILILESQTDRFRDVVIKYNTTLLDKNFFNTKDPQDTILKYCRYTQKDFMPKLDEVVEYKIKSFLILDDVTRRNLEIRRTRRYLKKQGSLFWFLNYAKTPMGVRLLKKYLDEPLLNISQIEMRLDAVNELVLNEKITEDLSKYLEQFCDLSRICAKVSNSTILPKDLYSLVKSANIIDELFIICDKFNSDLLKMNFKYAKEIVEFSKMVEVALSENSSDDIKTGGIINNGFDSTLDYLREKLQKLEFKIDECFKNIKRKLSIEKLKTDYSKSIGYYFELPLSKEKLLTSDCIRKQVLSSAARYTTPELQKLEEEIFGLKFKINELEYELYLSIRQKANTFVDKIRYVSKEIARIDVFNSLAICAIKNNLKRPEFKNKNIYIKNGFHPALLSANTKIVKNDTSFLDNSMIILTGANMSGKSTYLKQIAIILILAQIGSFIPADCAELEIVDKIFVRQGSTDDISNNSSSFMIEMNDLKFIIENATDDSLILLDEPAKSTNAVEAGAIVKAFCDYLISRFKTKTMIATHNIELTKLEAKYPERVFNYVVGASNDSEKINSDRKVVRGVVNSSLALNTAILANLPKEIISKAKEYLSC